MPSIRIDVRRSYTPQQETALMEAVHATLVEAFAIDPANRNITLCVHAPHRLMGRPDCAQPEWLTNISIYLLPGRSAAAKRRLYQGLVARLGALGIPGECLLVRLHEMPGENIAVRGGQAVCDLDLGYPVDV